MRGVWWQSQHGGTSCRTSTCADGRKAKACTVRKKACTAVLLCAAATLAQSACPAPTLDFLWNQPSIRKALLSQNAAGLELHRMPQVQPGPHGAGQWVHLGASGPVHGVLAWVPCGVSRHASDLRVLDTGGFVGWSASPAQGPLPPRLALTHRRTGTGIELHETVVVALQRGRLHVLLREVTHEALALTEQRETKRYLTWQGRGMRVAISTATQVDGRDLAPTYRQLCWVPKHQHYGRCPAAGKTTARLQPPPSFQALSDGTNLRLSGMPCTPYRPVPSTSPFEDLLG